MLGLIYSVLLLLTGAALIGGLMSWRTLARVKRLERAVEQLRREGPQIRSAISTQADAPAESTEPVEQPTTAAPPQQPGEQAQPAAGGDPAPPGAPSAIGQLVTNLRQNWMIWLPKPQE